MAYSEAVPQDATLNLLPLSTMSMLPFPADSAEFEEYVSVMESMADEAEASTPDPEPEDFEEDDYHPNSQEEDEAYWASMDERDYGGEDSYPDCYWEDQSEYGMDGCCGNF